MDGNMNPKVLYVLYVFISVLKYLLIYLMSKYNCKASFIIKATPNYLLIDFPSESFIKFNPVLN